MKKSRKITIIMVVLAAIASAVYIGYNQYNLMLEEKYDIDELEIGKMIYIGVEKGDVYDYAVMDNDKVIPSDKREAIVEYMKTNNLILKEGIYKFNQADTVEEILKALEFTKHK